MIHEQELSFPPLRFHTLEVNDAEGCMIAGTLTQGVFRWGDDMTWERIDDGLPEDAVIHQVRMIDAKLYASTSRGLFVRTNDTWRTCGMKYSCHRVIQVGHALAATDRGLMYSQNSEQEIWRPVIYPGKAAFDALLTPHYLFIACNLGFAYYDMLVNKWDTLPLEEPIVSLGLWNKRIVGVMANGRLAVGNLHGGFERIGYDGFHFYKVVSDGGNLYACSNRGLFRFALIGGRMCLHSMGAGFPVTDALFKDGSVYLATLHHGIRAIQQQNHHN